jgi:Immunity protein 21
MLKIIESYGGPLLMLERELLPYWGGLDNVGGVCPERADREPLNDYKRACAIRELIAPLEVLTESGVVFSGDDLGLGLERENHAVFFAVRMYYEIDNLQHHIEFVKKNPNCFKKNFDILMPGSNMIVFDSVAPGVELRSGYLEFEIVPGFYEVLTYKQKTPDAEIVFHKFQMRLDM